MNIGIVIIGDEILSGKRRDGHFAHVVEALAKRGLELKWCRIIGDDPAFIVETLRQTYASGDIVFSFGGIGATPDDHTRRCAAVAADMDFVRHPEAVAEIEAQFGAQAYPQRILMADLPAGSTLIPNPFNRIPGFSINRHHFVPGFPQMAWPMLEWVLDHHYLELHDLAPETELVITAFDVMESPLLDVMNELVRRWPQVRFSSLPHIGEDGRRLELSVRGRTGQTAEAMDFLKSEIASLGYRWEDR
ncbi:MAG: competence/damage-inducible protein A [Sulfuricella sp.]|nr:competence/damage-inducible protein A [Sulfuricella sp.]